MVFWKWWTIFVVTWVAIIFGDYYLNIKEYLLVTDITKISLLILAIFTLSSIYVGVLAYQRQFRNRISKNNQFIWFVSKTLQDLGLIGTFVGFIFVLTTVFQNFDSFTASQVKVLISELAQGMGIALITSLTGLISSVLLQFQLMILEQTNEEKLLRY